MYTNEPYIQIRLVWHPRMSPIHQWVIHEWALYTHEPCIPMSHINEPYIQIRRVCHPRMSPLYQRAMYNQSAIFTNEPYIPVSHIYQSAIYTNDPYTQSRRVCHPRMSPMYQWAMYTNEPYTSMSHTYRLDSYGVALVSRIDKMIGLFCTRALWNRQYSTKETYDVIDPTNRSHPICHASKHALLVYVAHLCMTYRVTYRVATVGICGSFVHDI